MFPVVAGHIFPLDHIGDRVGQFGQEIDLGRINCHFQGVVVDGAQAGNGASSASQPIVSVNHVVQVSAGGVGAQGRVSGPFPGEDNIGGGEG